MFTINLPLRQAREEQNYAPRSAKHDQNHFGIQGKCTPMCLTSLIKFSLLSNNSSRLIVLWIKSAPRTFSSWQPPRQQCGGCKEKIYYQNYSRQIQFLIRLRIIDVFCSLTTWLLLHYELHLYWSAVFMLCSIAKELTVAPQNSTGFVFLWPPNDPMIFRLHDWVIYQRKSMRQAFQAIPARMCF